MSVVNPFGATETDAAILPDEETKDAGYLSAHVRLLIDLKDVGGKSRILLRMADFGDVNDVRVIEKDEEKGGYFLAVRDSVYINFELDPRYEWAFDRSWDCIRIKDQGAGDFYRVHASGNKPTSVRLACRKNAEAGNVVQTHGFNLYVLLPQDEGPDIPVRIDPDIKNPPPPPSRSIPVDREAAVPVRNV